MKELLTNTEKELLRINVMFFFLSLLGLLLTESMVLLVLFIGGAMFTISFILAILSPRSGLIR